MSVADFTVNSIGVIDSWEVEIGSGRTRHRLRVRVEEDWRGEGTVASDGGERMQDAEILDTRACRPSGGLAAAQPSRLPPPSIPRWVVFS